MATTTGCSLRTTASPNWWLVWGDPRLDLVRATYAELRPESTAMNANGDIAFVGVVVDPTLAGGSVSALWIDRIDRPVEFALNLSELLGPTAPGSGLPGAQNVVMNESGQVAFLSTSLEGGLWWFDPVIGAQRVVNTGEQLLINMDGTPAVKTISDIRIGGLSGSGLSPAPYLSDDGEVVFTASFTDNSYAVIVWSPVPEPTSLIVAASPVAVAVCRRQRLKRAPTRES